MKEIRFLAKVCGQACLLLLALFGPIGSFDWMLGRYCLRALGAGWFVTALLLWIGNRKLFLRRTSTSEQTPAWDSWILLGIQLSTLSIFAMASLDSGRQALEVDWLYFGWGCALLWMGQWVFLLSLLQNPFFAVTICPQEDQKVVVGGVYAWIRHPGYWGLLMGSLGIPLMLRSTWALWPWLALLALLVVRIQREEGYLQRQLTGYREYQQRTLFRLIPGLW